MRFMFRLLAAAVACLASVSTANAAPIIIDSFTQGSYAAGNGANKTGSSGPQGILTDIVANRTTSHTSSDAVTTFGTLEGVLLNSGSALGQLELSSGTDTSATITLDYALNGTLTLTSGGIEFDFGGIEAGLATSVLDADVFVNGILYSLLPFPEGGAGVYTRSDPAWLNIPITSLQFVFNTKANFGTDFTLREIRVQDGEFILQGDPVPEPASMIVFGVLALGGGLAVARRQRLARRATTA